MGSHSEQSGLEKGRGQSVPTSSLPLTSPLPPTHPGSFLPSPAGTHLHFLCPVPDPHHSGTPGPLSSLHLLGIKEPRAQLKSLGVSILGRMLVRLQVMVGMDGCLWGRV